RSIIGLQGAHYHGRIALKASRHWARENSRKLQEAAAQTALGRSFVRAPAFWVSLAVVIAALLSSVATFFILNGLTPIVPNPFVVVTTLSINVLLVLTIVGIIGFQIVKLLKARKRQTAGAGLHFRIAGIFSLVALFPAVLLAIFATVSIDRAFDTIFSTEV